MIFIVYKRTQFTEPGKISSSTYVYFKKLLSENPHFELADNPPDFTSHFRRTFKNLSWMLAATLLLCLIFGFFFRPAVHPPDAISTSLLIITGIIGATTLGLLLKVLLEGPSYATFLKKRNAYFEQMKIAIRNSEDYQNFYYDFYSGAKKGFAIGKTQSSQGQSLDSLLTEAFYLIDKYWWILFIAGAALFFGRKLFS